MDKIKLYYESIQSQQSPEELVAYVKSNVVNAKTVIFRWSTVIVSVCLVVMLGIGAGAAGLLDVSKLFDGQLQSDDLVLISELQGAAKDLKVNMPDKTYEIVMNAVTGDRHSVVFNFSIVRKDGKPVMENDDSSEPMRIYGFSDCFIEDGVQRFNFERCVKYVDEKGNISVYVKVSRGYELFEDFTGKKFVYTGGSFYEYADYMQYVNTTEVPAKEAFEKGVEIGEPILELEPWSLEFVYEPSEKAQERILCKSLELEVPFIFDVTKQEEQEIILLKEIELSHIGGMLTVCYDRKKHGDAALQGYEWIEAEGANQFYLLMKDGSIEPIYAAKVAASYLETHKGIVTNVLQLEYRTKDFSDIPRIIDLSQVDALVINDFVYKLQEGK